MGNRGGILGPHAHPSDVPSASWGEAGNLRAHFTLKGRLLESVPLVGVTTWTVPVVAPAGTVVVIRECEFTVNTAGVPLKVTLVAPVRSVPSGLSQ
jgi:hypothetical protein